MKKEIKIGVEYSITIPLWRGDGWDTGPGPIESHQADLDGLHLSNETIELLKKLQQPTNDCWKIVETKLNGNWSMYTEDEFEKARIELGISAFPTPEEANETMVEIIKRLREELPADEYIVIDA